MEEPPQIYVRTLHLFDRTMRGHNCSDVCSSLAEPHNLPCPVIVLLSKALALCGVFTGL